MDNKNEAQNPVIPAEKTEVILPDAVVSIKVSTGFYQRLNNIVTFLVEGKSQTEIESSHAQIKAKDIKEPWIHHMQTLYIFLREFQKEAKAAGFVKNLTQEEMKEALLKFQNSVDENNVKPEVVEEVLKEEDKD